MAFPSCKLLSSIILANSILRGKNNPGTLRGWHSGQRTGVTQPWELKFTSYVHTPIYLNLNLSRQDKFDIYNDLVLFPIPPKQWTQ